MSRFGAARRNVGHELVAVSTEAHRDDEAATWARGKGSAPEDRRDSPLEFKAVVATRLTLYDQLCRRFVTAWLRVRRSGEEQNQSQKTHVSFYLKEPPGGPFLEGERQGKRRSQRERRGPGETSEGG